MKLLRSALVVGLGALTASLLSVAPAGAINRVWGDECFTNPTQPPQGEFMMVWTGAGQSSSTVVCWANAGTVEVALYGVGLVRSGNNKVVVTYQKDLNGVYQSRIMNKWERWDILAEGRPVHKISQITIL